MSSPFLNPGRIVVASGTFLGGTVGLVTTAFSVPTNLDCGVGATAISATVCEADFTAVGATSWTPPSNVTTVEALIVGGGGSGDSFVGLGYAGGGGEVKIVTLDNTGEVTVTVGAKNNSSSTVQGSMPISAAPGSLGSFGGASGNGNTGASNNGHAGGGAGGAASGNVGGPGVVVSSLSSTLFQDDNDCLGGGGGSILYDYNGNLPAGQQYNWYLGGATCGAGYADETNDVIALHAAVENTGGGGAANGANGDANSGAAGRVTIRFTFADATTTTTESVLAQTGSNSKPLVELGLFLAALGSVGYLAGRRRTKA
jgi:LPXTG-motif cell wall-anchored protein